MREDLRPWFETVHLHPDVESGGLATSTFAIDFGGVLAGASSVPGVYRDSNAFWQATHLTSGIRRLLDEVLTRLSGQPGDRVLQLRSPFGGGKSHVLVSLYHAVNDREALNAGVPDADGLPNPGKAITAGVDGEKFDPTTGTEVNGIRINTLWGLLAAQLGCFGMVQEQERQRVSPGGETVQNMLGDKPILILLDEVLRYVERGLGIPVGETNLGRQTLEFLQTLATEVANSTKAVMVYSLQASSGEAFGNVGLLNTLDHLVSRVDTKREPVVGDEILNVLKKRLLSSPPQREVSGQAAQAIAQMVTQWKVAGASDDGTRRLAQDEQIRLNQRLADAYPFHVGLIDLMKERWASIPEFQRTRGALRFLAAVTCKAKKLTRRSLVLGPCDVPIDDPDVRNAFFTEVGQREPFQAVLEHDLTGANARARRIDLRLAQQNPGLSAVRPAMRLATAILMYSFGGIPREEAGESLPSGITEKDLLEVCLSPEIDGITAQSVLKSLRDECLYLHYDGVRYCFKTIPNVNKILEDEAENVRRQPGEISKFIKDELQKKVGQVTNAAIIWPEGSSNIPDTEPRFLMVYLHPEFAEKTERDRESFALGLLTQYGPQPRRFRNGLGLAVPDRRQLEGLRRSACYLLAAEQVRNKRSTYGLTKEQLEQLKERERTERGGFDSALRAIYSAVWLLKMDDGKPALDKIEIGGRPLSEQGIHERLIQLLKDVERKLFDTLHPQKILAHVRIGTGDNERNSIQVSVIRDAFFESLGFPRLISDDVIAKAIARGIKDGTFAYALKNRVREESGKYTVKRGDAYYQREVGVDEIDMEAGVILLPGCLEADQPVGPAQPDTQPKPPEPVPDIGPTPPITPVPPTPGQDKIKTVKLNMKLTKQMLYKTFEALGNLAGEAGNIRVVVEAESIVGMERNWFRNAVREPLEESIKEIDIKEN